ncbi:MAG: protein-disulfide reductase DsbD domain-containing protein, partial [bacterium]
MTPSFWISMRRGFSLFALYAILAFAPSLLTASPDDPAKAALISDSQGFVPGQGFTLALRLDQDPGWHTYWKDPGDAGLPTTLNLSLPKGVHAGALEWPRPKVFKGDGNLTCYGYDSPALLLVPITVDPGYASNSLTIKAKSTWLVCKNICLPGQAALSLTLKRLVKNLPSASAPLFVKLEPSLGQPPAGYKPSAAGLGQPTETSAGAAPAPASTPAPRTAAASAPAGEIHTQPMIPAENPIPAGPSESLAWMLLLALAGGLLLNLMPCVLPVLSLKALSFVKQAHESRARVWALTGAFGAGILFSFWALAALVLLLKQGGQAVGWGFQFQQPGFVLFMAGLLVVFSLNLFGVFEILLPGGAAKGLSGVSRGGGMVGAFGQGLVITLLATPCTAPFLGTA